MVARTVGVIYHYTHEEEDSQAFVAVIIVYNKKYQRSYPQFSAGE